MKISDIEKVAPHIVKLSRQYIAPFKNDSNSIDVEFELSPPEYLIAYAYSEKVGIKVPDCIKLLEDFKTLQKAFYGDAHQ